MSNQIAEQEQEQQTDAYCEYFLKHHFKGDKWDDFVFKFGGKVACCNPKCPYDNQTGPRRRWEGEEPSFRICGTGGLKELVD